MSEEMHPKNSETPPKNPSDNDTSGSPASWSLNALLHRLKPPNAEQDDMFAQILVAAGEFGTFQRRLVALTFIPTSLSTFFMFADYFMFTSQTFHCNTSWIMAVGPNLSETEQLNLTLPRKPNGSFQECLMYLPVAWNLDSIIHFGLNHTVPCSHGWVYPNAQKRSLINEFDLVCDQKSDKGAVHTMFWSGILIGSVIFGFISDTLGRYPSILLSLLGLIIFGFGTAFVRNFHQYLFFRFALSQMVIGYIISSVTLASEWLVGEHRAHAIILENCCISLGIISLTGLAYILPHWRLLFLVGGAPLFILISYIWILPESPRWLMMKGKVEEAKKVLCYAAGINKKTIPLSLLDKLQLPSKKMTEASFLDFYTNSYLRKVALVIFYVCFAVGYNYFLLDSQIKSFSDDIHAILLMPSIMKVPARLCCIFFLEQMGRKRTMTMTFLLGCFLCLVVLLIHPELKSTYALLIMFGEFSLGASFTVLLIYSAELHPTILRSSGLGLMILAAATGAIVSFMAITEEHSSVPSFLCCFTATLALLLCSLLPEMQNQALYDKLEHLPTEKKSLPQEMTDDVASDDVTEEVAKNTIFNATMKPFPVDSLSRMDAQTHRNRNREVEKKADRGMVPRSSLIGVE